MANAEAVNFNAVEKLQTVLEENIDDPNNDRNGSNRWIYTIPISFDIAQYPRIHITETSATHTGFSVGSTDRQVDTQVQISVFCHVNNKFDIDNDGEKEGPREIISYLNQRVTEILNSNQSKFKEVDDCVHYFLTTNETLVQDSKNSVLQNNIDAELRTIK